MTNKSPAEFKTWKAGQEKQRLHSFFSCDQNGWDRDQWCLCGPGQSISRFESRHSNRHKDRSWTLQCRDITVIDMESRHYGLNGSGNNYWDSSFQWHGYSSNAYMVGMYSSHDNHREDRTYRVLYAINPNMKLTDCSGWIKLNGWDQHVFRDLRSPEVISALYSHHSNHHEDREFYIGVCKLVPR